MDGRERINKKTKKEAEWNPSERDSITLDPDLDFVRKTIEEAALQIAEEEEKYFLIVLMGIIRKRLREDPTIAEKLRELLKLDDYFKQLKTRPLKIQRKKGKKGRLWIWI